MKKFLVMLCAFGITLNAGAQSFLDALKGIANTMVNTAVNQATFSLEGDWTYQGVAIQLKSDDILSSTAAKTSMATLEQKGNDMLAKAGIKPGMAVFHFGNDGAFSLSCGKISIPGTWECEDKQLTISMGKPLKLELKGSIVVTSSGCDLVFPADKFIDFVDKALTIIGKIKSESASIASMQAAVKMIEGARIGFALTK